MRWTVVVAMSLFLAGCASEPAPSVDEPSEPEVEIFDPYFLNETGTLRSIPGLPGSASGEFQVPNATGLLSATLTWSDPVAELQVELTPPHGDPALFASPGAGRVTGAFPEPHAGAWTYTVTGSNALDVPWSLVLFLSPGGEGITILEETVTIPAGSFFEINTQMAEGARIHWDWTTNADSAFNVHTHFDDEVQYLVEETTDAHKGSIVQDREGGLSLMWEADTPIQLTYKAWGAFEVDSYFPPR